MVHLSYVRLGTMRTFGLMMKGKKYGSRSQIKHQRFQDAIDPEEIVTHYSRDDIDQLDPRAGERTYKDAQQNIGRRNLLLPNLSAQDLALNQLYQQEMDRQRALVARINKIQVTIDSTPGKGTELQMNQNISTPFDCARHINNLLTTRSVVAEISPREQVNTSAIEKTDTPSDSEPTAKTKSTYWDMHRPLESDCKLKFRHFTDKDLEEINKIYWRSCSFVLGMAIRLAFKDEIKVLLHSWPKPNVRSGSFVYDVALNLKNKWKPDEQELRAFTKIMWNIKGASLPFERLQVSRDVARQMFESNPFKLSQIDSIAESESSQGKVTVYRCGGLLDMSVGPMISDTSQIGRITLAAVHPFESTVQDCEGVFYRFQGVSLPQQLPVSSFIYQNILINQAKKLNKNALHC